MSRTRYGVPALDRKLAFAQLWLGRRMTYSRDVRNRNAFSLARLYRPAPVTTSLYGMRLWHQFGCPQPSRLRKFAALALHGLALATVALTVVAVS